MSDSDLEVKFGAETSGLASGTKEAIDHVKEFAEGISGIQETLGELGEAIAAAFAVEKLAEFAEGMANLGLEIERTSQILGISTEQVGALDLIAKASGISLRELETAFGRMSRGIIDGSDTAKRAFEALGISMSSFRQQSTMEQLKELSDRFSRIKDGAEKDAIAMALLGRTGEQLVPLFNKGANAIDEWGAAAERAGVATKEEAVAAMTQLHEHMIEMNAALKGDSISAFMEFHGVIEGAVKIITDLAEEFSQAMKSGGWLKTGVDRLVFAFKGLEDVVAVIIKSFELAWNDISFVLDSIASALKGLNAVAAGVGTDIREEFSGVFRGLVAAASSAVDGVGQMFVKLGSIIKDALSGNFAAAKADFAGLKDGVSDAMAGISKGLSDAGNALDTQHTKEAYAEMLGEMSKRTTEWADTNRDLNKRLAEEIDRIWSTEAAKAPKGGDNDAHMSPSGGKDDQLRADMIAIEEEVKATKDAEKEKQKALDDSLKHHQITTTLWLQSTKDALDDELQDELDLYQKELALDGLKASQKAAILAKMADAQRQHDNAIIDSERKAADTTAQEWKKVTDDISSAFAGQVSGLLKGTETFAQAFKNVIGQLLTQFIEFCVKMLIQWVLTNTGMQSAYTTMQAAMAGIGATGAASTAAAQKPGIMASITADVGEAYAGLAAFFAPVLGPGAPAAAAAGAASIETTALSLAAFDRGSWELPGSGVAMVHQGEMIVPASHTPWAQSLMSNAAGGAGGGGDGGVVHNHSWNINAVDARSFVNMINDHASPLAKAVAKIFDSNPGLRPKFT